MKFKIPALVTAAAIAAVLGGAVITAPAQAANDPQISVSSNTMITVATYNICKLACTSPAPAWDTRRARIANVITSSLADVIGVEEATNWKTDAGISQWQDVQDLVASAGYKAPQLQDNRCVHQRCVNTARLLYNRYMVDQARFTALPSAGDLPLDQLLSEPLTVDPHRQVTWAYFTPKGSTQVVLVAAVHLTNAKTAAGEADRIAFGRGFTAWAEGMNAARGLSNVPVVLLGDLNSFDVRQPQGVQTVLRNAGWTDAYDAQTSTNRAFNTVNYGKRIRSGWPSRPVVAKNRPPSRIDYVLTRGPIVPWSYEVVAHLNPNGTFDSAYQGSDHLMVRAALELRPAA